VPVPQGARSGAAILAAMGDSDAKARDIVAKYGFNLRGAQVGGVPALRVSRHASPPPTHSIAVLTIPRPERWVLRPRLLRRICKRSCQ
jgi:hypothetical protein